MRYEFEEKNFVEKNWGEKVGGYL